MKILGVEPGESDVGNLQQGDLLIIQKYTKGS